MSIVEQTEEVMRQVWLEPRFRACCEWAEKYSLSSNLFAGIARIASRRELDEYFAGENPSVGERTVSFNAPPPEPDWDWWEPRYDSPGRRLAFREAEFQRTGKAQR